VPFGQRCTEVPTKEPREDIRVLAVLQGPLETEAGAELLSEPLLKLEDAWAELTVRGGNHGQDEGRDCTPCACRPGTAFWRWGIAVELEPVLLKQPAGRHARTDPASSTWACGL
jgi:hypothetical protein